MSHAVHSLDLNIIHEILVKDIIIQLLKGESIYFGRSVLFHFRKVIET